MLIRHYLKAILTVVIAYYITCLLVDKVFVRKISEASGSQKYRDLNRRLQPASQIIHVKQHSAFESVLHERSTEATTDNDRTKTSEQNQHQNIPRWQRNLGQRSSIYYLTAVVRVRLYEDDRARWTVAEFKQWIHYQFWAGAEHIYICNHFLKESERLEKPLEKYVNLDLVTVIPWNHIRAVPGSDTYQIDNGKNQDGCYNHVAETYGNRSVWQYNFDMDENPYSPINRREGFLTSFLRNLEKEESGRNLNDAVVDVRVQNFLLHGQGDRRRNTTYERINRITPRIANGNWKAIYKPKHVYDIGMHGAKHRLGKQLIANTAKLRMLHYWGGRLQEWGPDTPALYKFTVEFNDVRNTVGISVRRSLLAFNETDAFSFDTGP